MDIKRWLDSTWIPDDTGDAAVKSGSLEDRDRKRSHRHQSDSSVIQPAAGTFIAHDDTADLPKKHRTAAQRSDQCSEHSGSYTTSSDRYDRKPRRKTRHDRYEPKEGRSEARRDEYKKKEKRRLKNSKKRKERKNDHKSGIGIVQSFHAKNVPKDRLTLKLPETAGLFGRGKASSPVKGRGLPDLVFSEMRFLQKRKEPIKEQQNKETESKRRRKKDQTRGNEQEISSYFTSREPLSKQAEPVKKGSQHHPVPSSQSHEARQVSFAKSIHPTIELSKDERSSIRESRSAQRPSSNYLRWSESVEAPSMQTMGGRFIEPREINTDTRNATIRPRTLGASLNHNYNNTEPLERINIAGLTHLDAQVKTTGQPLPEKQRSLSGRSAVCHSVERVSGVSSSRAFSTRVESIKAVPNSMDAYKTPSLVQESNLKETGQPWHDIAERSDADVHAQQQGSYNMVPRSSSSFAKLLTACDTATNEQDGHTAGSEIRAYHTAYDALPHYTTGGGMFPDIYQSAMYQPSCDLSLWAHQSTFNLGVSNVSYVSGQQRSPDHQSHRQGNRAPDNEYADDGMPPLEGYGDLIEEPSFDHLGSESLSWAKDGTDQFEIAAEDPAGFDGPLLNQVVVVGAKDMVFEGLRRPNKLY